MAYAMFLPPRYYQNRVRTALVALTDVHNDKYRARIWPEVVHDGDFLAVRLTIGGRRPLRFAELFSYRNLEGMGDDEIRTKLQQWIDEARSLGSREQQRRSDGELPPPKPRPRKRAPATLKVVR